MVSVLLYHLRLDIAGRQILTGGFLGVDVFFVISGFLIASIIFGGLRDGDGFSYAAFYERRARRILPALFFVMALCVVPAALILMPTEFERFAESLVASTFFVSNHFWAINLDEYGTQSSLYEPFVHTWSLAVEEQFYFLFPFAALAIWRWGGKAPLWVAGLILAGVVGAEAFTLTSPTKSFFWLPSRIWELLAGVLLAWGSVHGATTFRHLRIAPALPSAGLALILLSVVLVDMKTMTHPGFVTIPAVAGACLIIWFATPGDPATRLLSSRPAVAIGLISYSLYLWHYPVFAFGRHVSLVPTHVDMAMWTAISFAMAFITFRFVERPFRNRSTTSRRIVVRGALASAAAVLAFALFTTVSDGFPGRFGRLAEVYYPGDIDNERLQRESWGPLNRHAGHDEITDMNHGGPTEHEARDLWFTDPASKKVLVIGNSHSKDIFNALELNKGLFPGYEFARFGIGQLAPDAQIRTLLGSPNFKAADQIVIAYRYLAGAMDAIDRLMVAITAEKSDVLMLGNTVEFPMVGNLPLFDWYARTHVETFDPAELDAIAFENRDKRVPEVNALVQAMAQKFGAAYRDKADFMCDEAAQTCVIVGGTEGRRKLIYDYGHYTIEGAKEYGARINSLHWFPPRNDRLTNHAVPVAP